jgi:hypothetical protein
MNLPFFRLRHRRESTKSHDEQLSTSLDKLVQAGTWSQILDLLTRYPELTSDASEALLGVRIASAIRDGDENERIALQQRLLLVRRWRAADTASIGNHVGPLEFLFPDLNRLLKQAQESAARYEQEEDVEALNIAVATWERILSHPDLPLTPPPFRSQVWRDAGVVLLDRYRMTHSFSDLERSIADLEQAADSVVSLEQVDYLTPLAAGLQARSSHTNSLADLQRAAALLEQAVALTADNSPDLLRRLDNHLTVLRDIYERTDDVTLLQRAIEVGERVVNQTPRGSDELLDRSALLEKFLSYRYQQIGDLIDLRRAIQLNLDIVNETKREDPIGRRQSNNLARSLWNYYRETGDLARLDQSVQILEDFLANTPLTSPDRAVQLANLSQVLQDRYDHFHDLSDLQRIVDLAEAALAQTPVESPDRARYLRQWGMNLLNLYDVTEEPVTLDRAAEAVEASLAATPPESPDRFDALEDVGLVVFRRYKVGSMPADLDRAIELAEQAVQKMPAGSVERAGKLHNLARALAERYERAGARADLIKAVPLFRESCERTVDVGAREGVGIAATCGYWAARRGEWQEAAEAFGYGMRAMNRVFGTQLLRGHKETWLRNARGIALSAGYAAAKAGRLDDAAVALEEGRALILSEVLKRDRTSLELLAEAGDADLVKRYRATAGRFAEAERSHAVAPFGPAQGDARPVRGWLVSRIKQPQRLPGPGLG